MKKYILAILVLILAAGVYFYKQTEENVSPYIGVEFPPYPEGVEFLGGGTVGIATTATHGVDNVKTPTGTEFWLNRFTGRDEGGQPSWIVTDVMPDLSNKDQRMVSGNNKCGKEGAPSIVTSDQSIGLVDAKEYSSKGVAPAIRAWKINLETEKFEEYSPEGIKCESETEPGYNG